MLWDRKVEDANLDDRGDDSAVAKNDTRTVKERRERLPETSHVYLSRMKEQYHQKSDLIEKHFEHCCRVGGISLDTHRTLRSES